MLVQKKIQGFKKIFFVFFILVLAGIIGYLVYVNFFDVNVKKAKFFNNKIETLKISKINPEIKNDFLNKSPYTNFKPGAKLPVEVEKAGRDNPFRFIPFFLLNN